MMAPRAQRLYVDTVTGEMGIFDSWATWPEPLAQLIRRTFDEWMASAETVDAWASRLERAIAGVGVSQPATVEEIAGIINKWQQHEYRHLTQQQSDESAAREIAARISAPAVPAEIVERAKEIMSRPITDPHLWNIRVADCQALVREIAAQPAPAPDPEAVELAKRLPSDAATANAIAVAWEAIKKLNGSHYITADEWSALAAAAAFVRRAAGEPGV